MDNSKDSQLFTAQRVYCSFDSISSSTSTKTKRTSKTNKFQIALSTASSVSNINVRIVAFASTSMGIKRNEGTEKLHLKSYYPQWEVTQISQYVLQLPTVTITRIKRRNRGKFYVKLHCLQQSVLRLLYYIVQFPSITSTITTKNRGTGNCTLSYTVIRRAVTKILMSYCIFRQPDNELTPRILNMAFVSIIGY